MKVYIGADHAGFALKEKLKTALARKHSVVDLTPKFVAGDDYPLVARKVVTAAMRAGKKAVLICGSAEGICIAANKIRGARAVPVFNEATAKLSELHNDANVLCLSGGEVKNASERKKLAKTKLTPAKAAKIVKIWLSTKFSGKARHKRRLREIKAMER